MLAKRNFTDRYDDEGIAVWKLWSKGFSYYTSTNEDQYGPFRVGPTYPLYMGHVTGQHGGRRRRHSHSLRGLCHVWQQNL